MSASKRSLYVLTAFFLLTLILAYIIQYNTIQTNQENTNTQLTELSNKIQQQQQIIQEQSNLIQEQNKTLTTYLNELERLKAKIIQLEASLETDANISLLTPLPFTEFNANNPNNTLEITSTMASWSQADRRVQFTLTYYSPEPMTNFTHRLQFCFTHVEAGDENQRGIGGIWQFTNEAVLPRLNSLSVWGEQVGSIDGVYYLFLHRRWMMILFS